MQIRFGQARGVWTHAAPRGSVRGATKQLLEDLRSLPETERSRFFLLLASRAFGEDDLSYEQVFGHLAGELFTASEAAEYLEISLPTFRRYVQRGVIAPVQLLGRNQMYATGDLKVLKRTRHPQRPDTA